MPHFTLTISPQGPLLNATVGVSQARQKALFEASQPIPNPVSIQAIIDTGATLTCLDLSVLQTLGLSPTGTAEINTPSTGISPAVVDQYDVSLLIPGAQGEIPLLIEVLPVVCVEGLRASQNFHGLIGRDILSKCLFTYNGTMGTFTLAF